jgi:hypothetical protein
MSDSTMRRAEALANLGMGELQARDFDSAAITNVLHCHLFSNEKENVRFYRMLRPRLRQKLFSNAAVPQRKYFSQEKLRVVVHLRRGDAQRHPHRMMPLEEYRTILQGVVAAVKLINGTQHIVVHSEGRVKDLLFLQEEFDAELVMDSDPLDAWLDFINADILVLSKSSFSYSAGVYSEGVVVYKPSLMKGQIMDWVSVGDADFVEQLKDTLVRKIAFSKFPGTGDPFFYI